jgi:hypothetical protein
MDEAKIKAAEALYPLLSHFHKIEDQPLQAVWQLFDSEILSRIVLVFKTVSLLVEAETDYDTVDFIVKESINEHKAGYLDVSQLEPWKQFIGKPFVWGWVTINKQGYCDGLLLSFDSITPNVILNVVASEIKVGLITIKRDHDISM